MLGIYAISRVFCSPKQTHSLSEVQGKQEENAVGIEKMLGVIQQLTDQREDLTANPHRGEGVLESEAESIERRIAQLKETIGSQELSKEDVRQIKREKARVEEQAAKQAASLEEKKAGLAEAKEQWEKVYELLEPTVDRYNALCTDDFDHLLPRSGRRRPRISRPTSTLSAGSWTAQLQNRLPERSKGRRILR